MTPDEFKALRKGRTQTQAASLFGVALRTWQDWESGDREPRGPARLLLRFVIEHPRTFAWLARQQGEPDNG